MMPRLTVLITCKDEMQHIGACIESVRGVADEILIADSGSTDGTWEFVQKQPECRTIQREYVNAGNFKNWAIPQATHEWILIVDADERVTPSLAHELRSALCHDDYDGYVIHRLNYFLGHPIRYGSWGRDRVTRLVRRNVAQYNESTDHSEIPLPRHRLGRLRSRMPHYTCSSYSKYLEKMQRYALQQAEVWYVQGRRPSLTHLLGNGPMRFLRSYIAEAGFLDGMPGLQVAVLTAYYSFLKQSQLWGMWHGEATARR
jgi:glycosyltransferase involved in cell wall biosynthesis